MNVLNEYFDKIYCINLDRRPDRWAKCTEQFNRLGLEVERFSAVDKKEIVNDTGITSGQLAFSLSHLSVIKLCQHNNLRNVFIFEDDVVLSDNVEEVFTRNIQHIPNDWGMLYLGGNHLSGKIPIGGEVYRLIGSLATHAYGITRDMFDMIPINFKHLIMTNPQPLDVYYAAFHKIVPSYLVQEGDRQLSWQDDGYSDIDEAECNYTWLR